MKSFKDFFKIIEINNCQLYEVDDTFTLTEKALSLPDGKVCCLILVREMTEMLFQSLHNEDTNSKKDFITQYTCSGCSGLIKFIRIPDNTITVVDSSASPALTEKEQKLFDQISHYPLLKDIPTNHLKKFIGCFKVMTVKRRSLLIEKGQLIKHLFIPMSGSLIVEDGGVPIAKLGKGEVCGEMSYFGNNTASTSVRTVENSTILAISGEDFGKIIEISHSVHNYMVRLLAKRLSNANSVRVSEFDFSMQGRVNEMTPAELLQIFHMHQKTGVLSLELPKGSGQVSFLEGAIVVANYDGKSGQNAVFAILAEKDGIYHFTNGLPAQLMKESAIGDFMMLLMEGVRRNDEE